ncbi:hypothetical protein [Stieleria mannarensis]|uniref:hypothetical protein n=1 Tax=Stieleria mannarensis TaxID=2755585 RepID=UPI0016016EF5|nr:hypothetical protein [Rhodopirellula sp. JC639]
MARDLGAIHADSGGVNRFGGNEDKRSGSVANGRIRRGMLTPTSAIVTRIEE